MKEEVKDSSFSTKRSQYDQSLEKEEVSFTYQKVGGQAYPPGEGGGKHTHQGRVGGKHTNKVRVGASIPTRGRWGASIPTRGVKHTSCI